MPMPSAKELAQALSSFLRAETKDEKGGGVSEGCGWGWGDGRREGEAERG